MTKRFVLYSLVEWALMTAILIMVQPLSIWRYIVVSVLLVLLLVITYTEGLYRFPNKYQD